MQSRCSRLLWKLQWLNSRKTQAEAAKAAAEAQQVGVETKLMPAEVQAKVMAAASKNTQDPMADEFEKRMKLADKIIKVEDIKSNERIASMQMQQKMQ
jgi:hypothetical protein